MYFYQKKKKVERKRHILTSSSVALFSEKRGLCRGRAVEPPRRRFLDLFRQKKG